MAAPQLSKFAARGAPAKHIELLNAFAERTEAASASECIKFLQQVAATRPARGGQELRKWTGECSVHHGFQRLREQLLVGEVMSSLGSSDVSRTYSQLQKLALNKDAEAIWPYVSSCLKGGEMDTMPMLMGIWTTAPKERLLDVDIFLSRAIEEATPSPSLLSLLATLKRSGDCPKSKSVIQVASRLSGRLPEFSPTDLAALQISLQRSTASSDLVRDLGARVKDELVKRIDATLKPYQLAFLVSHLQSCNDSLWPPLREQLLDAKGLAARELIDVCHFVQRVGGRDVEPAVFDFACKQLCALLQRELDAQLIKDIIDNWEVLIVDSKLSLTLLNTVVKLEKILSHTSLWPLIIRAHEIELLKQHPGLKKRMLRIVQILGARRKSTQNLTLRQMSSIAAALQSANIAESAVLSQMSSRFVEVYAEIRQRIGAGSRQAADALTADSSLKDEAGEATQQAVLEDDASLMGEVQRLMVSFWVQMSRSLAKDDHRLRSSLESFCLSGGDCHIDSAGLLQSLAELETCDGVEAVGLVNGLGSHLVLRLPQLHLADLLKSNTLCKIATVRRQIAIQVEERLRHSVEKGACDDGQDLDNFVNVLKQWSNGSFPLPVVSAVADSEFVSASVPKEASEATGIVSAQQNGVSGVVDYTQIVEVPSSVKSGVSEGGVVIAEELKSAEGHIKESEVAEQHAGAAVSVDNDQPAVSKPGEEELQENVSRVPESHDLATCESGVLTEVVSDSSKQREPVIDVELMQKTALLVLGSLPRIMEMEPEVSRQRLVASVSFASAFGTSDGQACELLRHCLHQATQVKPGASRVWTQVGAAELCFSFASLYGGLMPFDVASRLWNIVGLALSSRAAALPNELPHDQAAQFRTFGLVVKTLSSPSVSASLRLTPHAFTLQDFLEKLEQRGAKHVLSQVSTSDIIALDSFREDLPKAAPRELLEQHFAVPGTPYVVDIALPNQHSLLIVPRAEHRSVSKPGRLNGAGLLMERLLSARGWSVWWVWPEELQTSGLLQKLLSRSEAGGERSQDS